jgi:ketosteroid isomerase-like protein
VSENLDLVRSVYGSRERGDYSDVGWADPAIEYVIADGPTPATFTGLAELADGMRDLLSVWQDARVIVEEYRELDRERVLVLLRYSGRGKTSGFELDKLSTLGADVVQLQAGKVVRIVKYYDLDRARADLGLDG